MGISTHLTQGTLESPQNFQRLGARKKEREASEENLRLATARYEVGAGDIIEMIDAQTQMVRSDTDVINTAFDYAVSVASLLRAMGR